MPVTSQLERRAEIARLVPNSTQTGFVPFRQAFAQIPIITVALDLPIFRADNGRLAVLKAAHIRQNGLPQTYFEDNEESAEVQALLHGFLTGLAQDESGPILQELRRTATQTEPMLITVGGVVVNGNRRLAAMRALLGEDPVRFAAFGTVTVSVLPADASPHDVEMTEAALQMAPETKLAYGWIERRLKLRLHRALPGLSDADITKSYRLSTAAQIDDELSELQDVETYLAEFAGTPQDYPSVADKEAYFVGMRLNLEGFSADERETWKRAGFSMIHEAEALEIEAERYFPFSAPKPAYAAILCLLRLGNEFSVWPQRGENDQLPELSSKDHEALRRLFSDRDQSRPIATALVKQLDRLTTEHREQQLVSLRYLIQSTQNLNRQLAKIGADHFNKAQKRELGGVLSETQYHARMLSGERHSTFAERALSHIAGWIYFIRRKALLASKKIGAGGDPKT